MSSRKRLDLEIPTTAADIAALRRARRNTRVRSEDYLAFLAQFTVSPDALRKRKGPRGEPFRL